MKQTRVTTSWDDGHILDIKLAELLTRYNLAGTFYIAPKNRQISSSDRMGKEKIRELSAKFEIGAHTMTHPRLSQLNMGTAQREIIESKETLEGWTGKAVTSFCYPSGDYTAAHKQIVRDAGFSLARTIKRFSREAAIDPLELGTTVHAYRHWSDVRPIFREAGFANFSKQYFGWDDLAIALFEKTLASGGVFHIWGHSWEIEKNGDWKRLERVFQHISNHPEVRYVTNENLK